ncbi:hypothetical protein BV25DRAFT_920799 [Artomyces pyxidatus]|uniref:Uncharacterized protein n=1 Tax=Artomyces pyxidatus TaxID=48021 RepID=A0ACB8SVR4_9AGAM|nr:hypothetical protein BV25DRAFT_920799 [Artomyces pyxidatus]
MTSPPDLCDMCGKGLLDAVVEYDGTSCIHCVPMYSDRGLDARRETEQKHQCLIICSQKHVLFDFRSIDIVKWYTFMVRLRNATIESMSRTPEKYEMKALLEAVHRLPHTWRAVHQKSRKPSRESGAGEDGGAGRGGACGRPPKRPRSKTTASSKRARQRIMVWRSTVTSSDLEPADLDRVEPTGSHAIDAPLVTILASMGCQWIFCSTKKLYLTL